MIWHWTLLLWDDQSQDIFHKSSQRRRLLILAGMVLTGMVLDVPEAWAHKVNLFAFVEGDRVYLEGYFSDGKKAKNSHVQVFDEKGQLLLEGTTDPSGEYTFPLPRGVAQIRIALDAGLGHRTEYILTQADWEEDAQVVSDAGPGTVVSSDPEEGIPSASTETEALSAPPTPLNGMTLDEQELERIVRRAVEDALRPVMRSLSELQEKRQFSDIVGGIGLIFGVLGVVFYLKARRRQTASEKSRK